MCVCVCVCVCVCARARACACVCVWSKRHPSSGGPSSSGVCRSGRVRPCAFARAPLLFAKRALFALVGFNTQAALRRRRGAGRRLAGCLIAVSFITHGRARPCPLDGSLRSVRPFPFGCFGCRSRSFGWRVAYLCAPSVCPQATGARTGQPAARGAVLAMLVATPRAAEALAARARASLHTRVDARAGVAYHAIYNRIE